MTNTTKKTELEQLREENARLKALLTSHGISLEEPAAKPKPRIIESVPTTTSLSTSEKITLFRRLFRGRSDVYPLRWTSAKGKSGYLPACGNEWKPGICHKPNVKCGDCSQRLLLPITDQVIYDHLAGKHTIGIYPLLTDDGCCFLVADFDEADWREDARAFMRSCRELNIAAALEISRSCNGAHAWIFFADSVPAREARQLGAALISYICRCTRQLSLSSYDRLFPNQDILPKGGFGNLIALPLQKQPREQGRSVFVNEDFEPYPDQWAYLASIRPLSKAEREYAVLRACGGRHPLDVAFAVVEDNSKPWQRQASALTSSRRPGPLPESLNLVLASQIFIAKANLPQPLANRLGLYEYGRFAPTC